MHGQHQDTRGETGVYTCNESDEGLIGAEADETPETVDPHPNEARQLPLNHKPVSPEAERLIEDILHQVELREGRHYQRGAASQERLRAAVRALVGGLLLHAGRYGTSEWCWMQTSAGAFTGTGIGYRQYRAVEKAMLEAGLIEKLEGFNKFYGVPGEFGPGVALARRFAARFRGTERLWECARRHGIALEEVGQHFERLRPSDNTPVYIKPLSAKVAGRRIPGKHLSLPRSGKAAIELERIVAGVREVNAFVAGRQVEGCDPITFQRGYSVDLNHGGRWYARGDNYQNLPKEARLGLRIDGEPVAEVDVRASHLTILLGMQGLPLPEGDPYAGFGYPREVVKAWIVATLGAGAPAARWSPQAARSLREDGVSLDGITAAMVREAVLQRYPFLSTLPALLGCPQEPRLSSLRLMNIEANALTMAMQYLRVARDVLALPMHDSLIVPQSAVRAAEEALRQSYRAAIGLYPKLTVRVA
ncbi:MAG TPA: hypothetical protein VF194_07255 [Ferrovibrio sp.]|uniref:hypothetical protein n=1 Tax=Ferrovibrio sp. TaxID=1917215 RepID=UPI002ED47C11